MRLGLYRAYDPRVTRPNNQWQQKHRRALYADVLVWPFVWPVDPWLYPKCHEQFPHYATFMRLFLRTKFDKWFKRYLF